MQIEVLAETFERIVNKYNASSQKPRDFGTGVLLYRSEIHMIDTIGRHENLNMTKLAQLLGITKGGVFQTVERLIKKEMVLKKASPLTENEVVLSLTSLGQVAFSKHIQYHLQMYQQLEVYLSSLPPNSDKIIIKLLSELENFLDKKE